MRVRSGALCHIRFTIPHLTDPGEVRPPGPEVQARSRNAVARYHGEVQPPGSALYVARMLRSLPVVAALFVAVVAAAGLQAQGSRTLDVGSFTLLVDGVRVGREQFSLVGATSPDGPTYELRTEWAQGERRGAVRLETDSAGTPFRYAVEERTGTRVSLRLGGQRTRGRFATLARGSVGEAAREYVLEPGAIVLEPEGIHQYTLLLRGRRLEEGESISVPVLVPMANRQTRVRLLLESRDDRLVIGGGRQPAFRWLVTAPEGDAVQVWSDAEGRVLRLSAPARRFEATRDDVPR